MLNFESSLLILNLDVKKYTKTLDRVMGQIIREAAREWLRAILVSVPSRGGFPVETGAAKSTLQPLGRFLRVAVPISPTKPVRANDYEHRWGASDFSITSKNFEYEFSWSTDLLHYYLNEFFSISTVASSPWHSLEAGEAAFLSYVEEALERRLPNIEVEVSTEIF